jgi:hypothetical protein
MSKNFASPKGSAVALTEERVKRSNVRKGGRKERNK